MDAPVSRDSVLRKLGWCVAAVGGLGLIRLLPEFLSLRSIATTTYYSILILDVMLSGLSIGGGLGMHRGWKYGATLASIGAGGALFVNSAWMLVTLLTHPLSLSLVAMMFGPRMVYYAISIGFWPYALRIAFKALPSGGALRWILLVGSAAASGFVTGLILQAARG